MVGYILIILITTLIAATYQNTKNKAIFILLVLFPSFFCGFRESGTDYFIYLERFRYIARGLRVSISGTDLSAPFYGFFGLINHICGNYQVAIFIISFVTIFIAFYLICQHSEDISVSVAVFSYMTMFYFLSFNIFRQCLAAEFYALGIYLFVKKKKSVTGIMMLILSVLIHSSVFPFALVALILPWISENFRIKKRICVYLTLLTVVFLLPEMSMLTQKLLSALPHYAFYFLNFHYQGLGIGIFRYIFLVCVMILLLYKSGYLLEREYIAYSFLALNGAILTWMSYVSDTFIYRIGYIGLVFLPILHGYFVRQFLTMSRNNGSIQIVYRNTTKGKIASAFSLGLIVLLLFFFWYDFIYLNTGDILPYSMCFYIR